MLAGLGPAHPKPKNTMKEAQHALSPLPNRGDRMMPVASAAVSISGAALIFIVFGVLIWAGGALAVAGYGGSRGYPFVPLFASALAVGWGLVLVAVTIIAGPLGRHCPMCHRLVPTGRTSCDGCNYDFIDRKVYAS